MTLDPVGFLILVVALCAGLNLFLMILIEKMDRVKE